MSQNDNNKNAGSVSSLKISTDIIPFHPQAHSAEIVLSNLHPKYSLYFKIKTKIKNKFDVKPSLGCIKSNQQQTIAFRPLNKIEANQIANLQRNLQFLIQAVHQTSPDLIKQEQQALWKQIKTKKNATQLGYCSVKLRVSFSGKTGAEKELLPVFRKVISSRVSIQSESLIRPYTFMQNLQNSDMKSSINLEQFVSDAEKSKKYQQLKDKQQKLMKQRDRIFSATLEVNKAKGASLKKLIIILIITFVLGNYLRTVWDFKEEEKPQPIEKGLFDWFS